MKKTIAFLLIVILCLPSCAGIGDNLPKNESVSDNTAEAAPETHQIAENEKRVGDFAFSFTTEKTEYLPGETIHIYATVTNVSGEDHVYTGSSSAFMADIVMYWKNESGGELNYDPIPWAEDTIPWAEDHRLHTIKNETSRTTLYQFRIPDDVKTGYYDISLSYNGEVALWDNVILISPKYQQSDLMVYCGEVTIHPIEFFLSSSERLEDGSYIESDGLGISELFDDPDADLSVVPELIVGNKDIIQPLLHSHVSIESIDIYNKRLEKLAVSMTNIEALSDIEGGEYYIVITEKRHTDIKQLISRYQSIFKLIKEFPDGSVFSYVDVTSVYKEGVPGVVTSGFKNTEKTELEIINIHEASQRAIAEVTVEYNYVDVKYDPISGVWQVLFAQRNIPGGDQTVYLDSNGVTLLIVYGE